MPAFWQPEIGCIETSTCLDLNLSTGRTSNLKRLDITIIPTLRASASTNARRLLHPRPRCQPTARSIITTKDLTQKSDQTLDNMSTIHDHSALVIAQPASPLLSLPEDISKIVYGNLYLRITIRHADDSSPFLPKFLRVYGGDLVSLASIRNSALRRKVLSQKRSYEVLAKTAVHTNMRDLIISVLEPQVGNIVYLQMQVIIGRGQTAFDVIRYTPANFALRLRKLRRLAFILMEPADDSGLQSFRDFCDDITAVHPNLNTVNEWHAAGGIRGFTIT